MSINLLQTVQQNLGYPVIKKIDPNTQHAATDGYAHQEDKFSQAAIPAVLIGFYRYVLTDECAANFIQNDQSFNWIDAIFNDKKNEAVQAVAAYAAQTDEYTVEKMNAIAIETVLQVTIGQASGKLIVVVTLVPDIATTPAVGVQ